MRSHQPDRTNCYKAERRTTARLAAQILNHKTITEFEVIITGLMKSGLFVKLDDGASEGFVPDALCQMIFTKLWAAV